MSFEQNRIHHCKSRQPFTKQNIQQQTLIWKLVLSQLSIMSGDGAQNSFESKNDLSVETANRPDNQQIFPPTSLVKVVAADDLISPALESLQRQLCMARRSRCKFNSARKNREQCPTVFFWRRRIDTGQCDVAQREFTFFVHGVQRQVGCYRRLQGHLRQ